jgi:hypothetical protein
VREKESGTALLRSGEAALRLRAGSRMALQGSMDGIVRGDQRGDWNEGRVVDDDEWLWKCAERSAAERARNGRQVRPGNIAEPLGWSRLAFRAVRFLAEVSSRRASDQPEVRSRIWGG